MNIDTFGGRKVLLGIGVMSLGVAVDAVSPHGLSANLLDLLKFVAIGFFLGNGIEHVAGAMTKKTSSASPDAVDPVALVQAVGTDMGTVEGKVDELAKQVELTNQSLATVQQALGPIYHYVAKLNEKHPL